SILVRATRLLGVRTGYVYLGEEGDTHLTVRAAIGVMADFVGFRLPVDKGIGGTVFRTGKPLVIDDYDAFEDAAEIFRGKVGPGGTEKPSVAVLLIDLDRFEIVNESLGHAAGDRVLRDVATRIVSVLGPDDTVARFGGDSFAVLLPGSDADAAMAFAERVQLKLKPPFSLDGRTWVISASMGISVGAPGSTGGGDAREEA